MNKKGFSFFSDIVNIILIGVILVVFFMIMSFIDIGSMAKVKEKAGESCYNLRMHENDYVLLNYLRSPLEQDITYTFFDYVDGGSGEGIDATYVYIPPIVGTETIDTSSLTITDLIYLVRTEPSLLETLKQETKDILSPIYGNCFDVEIGGNRMDFETVGLSPESSLIYSVQYSEKLNCINLPVTLAQSFEVCLDLSKYTYLKDLKVEQRCFNNE